MRDVQYRALTFGGEERNRYEAFAFPLPLTSLQEGPVLETGGPMGSQQVSGSVEALENGEVGREGKV